MGNLASPGWLDMGGRPEAKDASLRQGAQSSRADSLRVFLLFDLFLLLFIYIFSFVFFSHYLGRGPAEVRTPVHTL